MNSKGRLIGVGVGPGDPKLLTVAAVEALSTAPVIAYLAAEGRDCLARLVAARYFNEDAVEHSYFAPMHGSEAELLEFYRQTAQEISVDLAAGRDVAFLCLGDPLFYGSFSYLLPHLQTSFAIETIPGITSFNASMAKLGLPLVLQQDHFAILPASGFTPNLLQDPALKGLVLMKLGARLANIRKQVNDLGLAGSTWIASRIGWPDERLTRLNDWGDTPPPYMSLMIIANTQSQR